MIRRRKKPARRASLWRSLPWHLLVAVFLVGLIVLGIWLAALDREIRQQFEGRRWNLPAQVYARPLELHAGLRLGVDDVQRELAGLGYRAAARADTHATFTRSGNRIELVTRPFAFWDGFQPATHAVLHFGSAGLMDLRDGQGQRLPLLRLDPPFIGNIFTVHGEDRVVVGPDEVPPLLLDGLRIVEDRDFDAHFGVSPRAILRALFVNLRSGEVQQGGSTLTQQLVRSYFLSNERTLARKLREAAMAILLELHFDKADLLNAYVNEIYLGQAGDRAIHGFGLASHFYFGKPLAELDVPEVALLIAIVRGPSWYDPRRNAERARKRRDMVLDLMATRGAIDPATARQAKATAITVRSGSGTFAGYNPAFMDRVRRELRSDYAEGDLQNAALRIHTTLDPRIQSLAEQQLTAGLRALEQSGNKSLDGAVIVTRTQTPDIVAIVGGRHTRLRGFNRALDARRPIGSLVKPVVYLAALQSGRWHAASRLDDAPLTVPLDRRRNWTPQNYDRQFRGPLPLVRGLVESLNVPTVQLGMDVGPDQVAALLARLGGVAAPRPLPSLLLGAVDLTPLEVAQLYNTLATGGFRAPLRTVRAVLDAEGAPLERFDLTLERAADPAAVAQLNAMLMLVTERGTARGAQRWLGPLRIAGKTGTSDDLRDSWFAGFSADHVGIVWVGSDDNAPTGLSGASGALPIWARLMADLGDQGYEPEPAGGLVMASFDYASGLRADGRCGDPVTLPLPDDSVLEVKPGCEHLGTAPPDPLRTGVRWLRGLFE